MIANHKKRYQSPTIQAVELQCKTSLCNVSNSSLDWTIDNNLLNPPGTGNWNRPDYGDVIEF